MEKTYRFLWNDFVAAVRSRFNGTDRAPYFTTQPTKYIQEMIHALQPKAKSIDVREYLKVFNKSILLRNIESVDNFVRDYIVEPQSIDRRRAKSQIEHFKQLSLLLEQVRKQIADLAEISAAYRDVERYTVRSSSIKALAAMFAHDELADYRCVPGYRSVRKRRGIRRHTDSTPQREAFLGQQTNRGNRTST